MSHQAEAEENLRVIRALMEKATVYRAISAEGALVGGLAAVAAAIGSRWLPMTGFLPDSFRFLALWGVVLFIAATVNLLLLSREARRRHEPFFSAGMRLALRAMLPALLGGAGVAYLTTALGPTLTASFWVLLYGISLLAASHFAPKSICWLGRAFFVAGMALSLGGFNLFYSWERGADSVAANDIMGATFGLFHLIYAACTWPRKAQSPAQP